MSNASGIKPVEFKVLVKPDKVEEKTKGGIFIPDAVNERHQMAECKGLLVEAGGRAFEDWPDGPKPGQRVLMAKYAGIVTKGQDGEEYRVANDKDVCAVLSE